MNKLNLYLATAVTLILISTSFYAGWYSHSKIKPCQTITTDTVEVYDPYWHHIADSLANLPPKEKIKWLPQDTLFVPGDTVFKNVDTAAILRDYYSVYRYSWDTLDKDLQIKLNTTVTRNQPIAYNLSYRILRPETIVNNTIDNSVHYNKYLYLGVDLPIKNFMYTEIEGIFAFQQGYVGIGYEPQVGGFNLKAGVTLLKFK